jgi:hypothetical protein
MTELRKAPDHKIQAYAYPGLVPSQPDRDQGPNDQDGRKEEDEGHQLARAVHMADTLLHVTLHLSHAGMGRLAARPRSDKGLSWAKR